jgi:rifampicin phosphotransferase
MSAPFLAFIGPPGSGKTTQIRALANTIGPEPLLIASVPRLIRQEPELLELLTVAERKQVQESVAEAHAARDRGELAPAHLDAILFHAIARLPPNISVAFDGCPRARLQARLFLELPELFKRTVIVHLSFPDNTREASLERQYRREKQKRGLAAAESRRPIFERKLGIYQQDTLAGIELLEKSGVPLINVSAMESQVVIQDTVLQLYRSLTPSANHSPRASDRLLQVPLFECHQFTPVLVGHKAHILSSLHGAGVVVLDGFCLTTEFFRSFQMHTPLGELITEQLQRAEHSPILRGQVNEYLRRAIQETPLPEFLREEIQTLVKPFLMQGPVIVRSSAPNEDSSFASHAGIYHSEVIAEAGEYEHALKRCWASLFTEKASFYQHGRISMDMAVLTQPFTDPDLSGVMFTRDPLKPGAGIVIELNHGGNESITAGHSAEQHIHISDTRSTSSLPPALASALQRTAAQVEFVLGEPADVEWAWKEAELIVLQARPVTTTFSHPFTGTKWALQEDVDQVYALELGHCERLFMRQLQKKVWFRQFCRDQEIDIFRILYLIYQPESLANFQESLFAMLRWPLIRADWGNQSTVVPKAHLIQTLADGWQNNPVANDNTACVQLGEIIPAEITGFASLLANGDVWIEAFPNGIRHIYSSRLTPSTWLMSDIGSILSAQIAQFQKRGQLDPEHGKWQEVETASFPLDLSSEILARLVQVVQRLSVQFGEVRIEWYLCGETVFVKDLSLETAPIAFNGDPTILSSGSAVGHVLKIEELAQFDALASQYGVSVVNHSSAQEAIYNASAIERIRHLSKEFGDLIAVADYPSMGLIPLIRFVKGFIFARGTLLGHTAIVLRENRVPALVWADAAELQDGDLVSISPAGLSILQRANS